MNKNKKALFLLLALVLLFATVGCAKKAAPKATPQPIASAAPQPSPVESPIASGEPTTVVIEGFEEGKTIEEGSLPEQVRKAISEAYANVKIKTISFASYLDQQMYLVTLEEPASDKTEQFYVKADGTIVPYATTDSAGTTPAA
jgi:hypothetical protein